MTLLRASRKAHKWLMLLLGIQFVIWSLSGAYMVILDIDYIHGDTLVAEHQDMLESKRIELSLQQLFSLFPEAEDISLDTLLKPLFIVLKWMDVFI